MIGGNCDASQTGRYLASAKGCLGSLLTRKDQAQTGQHGHDTRRGGNPDGVVFLGIDLQGTGLHDRRGFSPAQWLMNSPPIPRTIRTAPKIAIGFMNLSLNRRKTPGGNKSSLAIALVVDFAQVGAVHHPDRDDGIGEDLGDWF